MTAFAEKGFVFSAFLYAVSLPLSMAGTNFSLALLAAFTAALIYLHRAHWEIPVSFIWLSLFFLWAAVTAWIADRTLSLAPLGSFSKLWNTLPYVLIPMGSGLLSSRTGKIFWTVLSAGCGVVALGALQYWAGTPYFFEGTLSKHALIENTRFYGFQSHPLHTGALYSILFLSALSAALFYRENRRIFIAAVLAAGLLGLGVMLTGSRSYYLGLAAGSLLLFALRGWKFILGGAAALGLCAMLLFKADPNIENRMRTMGLSRMDESSFQRFYIWKSAGLMILEHPIAGAGYRRWAETLPKYAAASPNWTRLESALSHAHNSALTVAAETGLTGLGLFLCFWVVLIREQIAAYRAAAEGSLRRALAAGVLAIFPCLFVASLTEHNLLTATVSLALFFMAGLSRTEAA